MEHLCHQCPSLQCPENTEKGLGRKNVGVRGWGAGYCEVLSSEHDMANVLMTSKQPWWHAQETGGVAQQVKVLGGKPDHQSLISGTHTVEGDSPPLSVFSDLHICKVACICVTCTRWHAHVCTLWRAQDWIHQHSITNGAWVHEASLLLRGHFS